MIAVGLVLSSRINFNFFGRFAETFGIGPPCAGDIFVLVLTHANILMHYLWFAMFSLLYHSFYCTQGCSKFPCFQRN